MKQLLIRADDLGISYAVDLGIARSVNEGLVRSVGLMTNMPEAARGLSLLAGSDVAVGQHTNVCLGVPVSDPARIPSLLQEDGTFKSSRTYRACYKTGEDFVAFDEAVTEIEAQLGRFRELVGHDPDYFEAHAVLSDNLMRAITYVAEKNGLKEQPCSFDPTVVVRCGSTDTRMVLRSMQPGYDPKAAIVETVEEMADGETVVFVCHPGYLDDYILTHSSLTGDRAKEVDALIDPALRTWFGGQADLRLVDYRDL